MDHQGPGQKRPAAGAITGAIYSPIFPINLNGSEAEMGLAFP
jgi:hypothetical protein